jgi:gluconate kinase
MGLSQIFKKHFTSNEIFIHLAGQLNMIFPRISSRKKELFEYIVLKRILNKLEHKRSLVWGNFEK